MYDLKAKNVLQVLPQRQGFTIANQSLELTPDLHLVLRFRRSFDNSFTLTGQTVRALTICLSQPAGAEPAAA